MKKLIVITLSLGILVVACEEIAKQQMNSAENMVVEQSIEQYIIAKQNGSKMDAYVAAGMVKAACLQAEDSNCYKKYHKIETDLAKELNINL